jgi:hypothetical protein
MAETKWTPVSFVSSWVQEKGYPRRVMIYDYVSPPLTRIDPPDPQKSVFWTGYELFPDGHQQIEMEGWTSTTDEALIAAEKFLRRA